ncbi:PEP-CTERM sorting domain-containing protein [Akkermansiaceae bacterium]|nr:PEP-CTERM sorting domain-containing protein [Akkermansiaceae bacterium]
MEVFKWGTSEFKPNIGIDDWSLKTSGDAVPEPSSIALVSLAGLFLLRRRK